MEGMRGRRGRVPLAEAKRGCLGWRKGKGGKGREDRARTTGITGNQPLCQPHAQHHRHCPMLSLTLHALLECVYILSLTPEALALDWCRRSLLGSGRGRWCWLCSASRATVSRCRGGLGGRRLGIQPPDTGSTVGTLGWRPAGGLGRGGRGV